MYNNMPYMPDFNNMNPINKINDLEQEINRIEREIKRLNHRINKLENNKSYVSTTYETTNNYNYEDSDGMYMM